MRPDEHQHKTVGSFLRSLGLSLPSYSRIVIKCFFDTARVDCESFTLFCRPLAGLFAGHLGKLPNPERDDWIEMATA